MTIMTPILPLQLCRDCATTPPISPGPLPLAEGYYSCPKCRKVFSVGGPAPKLTTNDPVYQFLHERSDADHAPDDHWSRSDIACVAIAILLRTIQAGLLLAAFFTICKAIKLYGIQFLMP